jgi:hypothetical protein
MAGKAFTAVRSSDATTSTNSIIVTVSAESGLDPVAAGAARLIFEDTMTANDALDLVKALETALIRRISAIGADTFANIPNAASRE